LLLKGLNSHLQPLNPALLTRFGFPKFPDLLGSFGRLLSSDLDCVACGPPSSWQL